MNVDAIADILERAGLSYVEARRTAKEILALPPEQTPTRPPTKLVTIEQVAAQAEAAIKIEG